MWSSIRLLSPDVPCSRGVFVNFSLSAWLSRSTVAGLAASSVWEADLLQDFAELRTAAFLFQR
jgi:hypothetical protein